MNYIDTIERLVKKDEILCADVICQDNGITTLQLLILLKKYMNMSENLQ